MSAPESWHVIRTLRTLELLAVRPRSAPRLADELGVHPRTARRLLKRLAEQGYVVRNDETRTYSTTMRIVALAGQVVERAELGQIALPYVSRLREQSGETSHLSVASYTSALCLVHDAGDGPETVRPRLRELVPAHCTAAGKALLANRRRWGEAVVAEPLERHTDCTLVDRDELLVEFATIRERGYATEDLEYKADVRGVAAPIASHGGEVVAALGFTARAERLPADRLVSAGAAVAAVAADLSTALGAQEARPAGAQVNGSSGSPMARV